MRSLVRLLILLFVFVLGEASVRVLNPIDSEAESEANFIQRSIDLLEPCAKIESSQLGDDRLVGGEGPFFSLPMEPEEEALRVAVIGESSAAQIAVSMYKVAQNLRNKNGEIEVLNCASSGGSLEHVRRRGDEVLNYHPHVVVIAFGHNLEFEYPMNRLGLRAWSLFYESRLLSTMRKMFRSSPPATTSSHSQRLKHFDQWLRSYLSATERDRVRSILATVTPNMLMPPRGGDDVINRPEFLSARFRYFSADRGEAIAALSELISENSNPHWQYQLGLWLYREEQGEAAKKWLKRALNGEGGANDLGRAPTGRDRATTEVNDSIRQAARDAGIRVRDTAAVIETSSRFGIPGWEAMVDHCHLQEPFFEAEGRAILKMALDSDGNAAGVLNQGGGGYPQILGLMKAWQDPRVPQALSVATETWLRLDPVTTDRNVDEYLSELRKMPEVPQHHGRKLVGIAQAYWFFGDAQRARELNRYAENWGIARAWSLAAKMRLADGDKQGAIAALDTATEFNPPSSEDRYFLERLRQHQGK